MTNKVLQFPQNRFSSQSGWGERILCAATYGVLILADAANLFTGDLLPFMAAGLVYYALFHHRRVRLAKSQFVRYHLLQAILLTTLLKVLLAMVQALLAFVASTLALVRLSIPLELTLLWVGYGAVVGLGLLLIYATVMCLLGRQFRIRWVSDWVDRMS